MLRMVKKNCGVGLDLLTFDVGMVRDTKRRESGGQVTTFNKGKEKTRE